MEEQQYLIAQGALASTVDLYAKVWGERSPMVIADRNTWPLIGASVYDMFQSAGYIQVEKFIFPDTQDVYADYEHVRMVRELLEENEYIGVAVGSGTINDLVKLASYECGKSYMVIPTAPSVDGYTAVSAAITVDGFKKTIACSQAQVMVADEGLLSNAPYEMIASGYGDLAAKIPAGADWIIADRLGIEPIMPEAWALSQSKLRQRIADPQAIANRNGEAIVNLFMGLVDVGFAMRVYKDSRPASGAEHLLSHVWEMAHLSKNGSPVSHGFKVALGTLTSTAIMMELLKLSKEDLLQVISQQPSCSWGERLHTIEKLLAGDPTKDETIRAAKAKFLGNEALQKRRMSILSLWEDLKNDIATQIIPFEQLKAMFRTAQCPHEPADICLSKDLFIHGLRKAQLIRNRYTALDLVFELGLFEGLIDTQAHSGIYFNYFAQGVHDATDTEA
jgi:glycerol-1-phosphate dehydrogenase [NAD(P)+]